LKHSKDDFSIINDQHIPLRAELQAFLISFIEQSPPPAKEGLRHIIREPMFTERIFGILPENRSKDSNCILYPDHLTWAQDFSFLKVTFLGIEFQLLLHDILLYNMFHLSIPESQFLSMALTYLVHLFRLSVRLFFGSRNVFNKAFLDERFRV
jgi:hypothetical protein